MEGGYKCLREPLKVKKPEDKFIPVYEYKWKYEELPSTTRNVLLVNIEEEYKALQEGKSRAIIVLNSSLDVSFYFAKVDSSIYLAAAHAFSARRPKNERIEISSFINNLASQLRVFG